MNNCNDDVNQQEINTNLQAMIQERLEWRETFKTEFWKELHSTCVKSWRNKITFKLLKNATLAMVTGGLAVDPGDMFEMVGVEDLIEVASTNRGFPWLDQNEGIGWGDLRVAAQMGYEQSSEQSPELRRDDLFLKWRECSLECCLLQILAEKFETIMTRICINEDAQKVIKIVKKMPKILGPNKKDVIMRNLSGGKQGGDDIPSVRCRINSYSSTVGWKLLQNNIQNHQKEQIEKVLQEV